MLSFHESEVRETPNQDLLLVTGEIKAQVGSENNNYELQCKLVIGCWNSAPRPLGDWTEAPFST